jgi:hypothetical protein
MKSFLTACVVAIVLALGAAYVLETFQQPADHAYASSSGARI